MTPLYQDDLRLSIKSHWRWNKTCEEFILASVYLYGITWKPPQPIPTRTPPPSRQQPRVAAALMSSTAAREVFEEGQKKLQTQHRPMVVAGLDLCRGRGDFRFVIFSQPAP